jgi:hypothetical protein
MQFKISLVVSFLLVAMSASAQINQGAILIGGNLSFSREESNSFQQMANRFTFSPAIGKAIKENLIVGVDLTYSRQKSYGVGNSFFNFNSKTYGGGIFLRSYKVVAKNFYLFGQGRIGTYFQQDEETNNTSSRKSATLGINIAIYPGIAYEITKKLQLEAGFPELFYVGYTSGRSTYNPGSGPNRTRGFGVSTSLTNGTPLSIGMRLLINGKMNN